MPLTGSLSLTTAKRRIALSVVTRARTKKAVVEGKGPGTDALVARLAATQPVRRNSFMSQIRAHEEKEEGIMKDNIKHGVYDHPPWIPNSPRDLSGQGMDREQHEDGLIQTRIP
ncbi:hypothetical protein RRG08_066184 [Elysia crispata]|uniref:Uncharacterized protein n=1 Tax=Elysia crispata TaxID=231223 RepID=A0AAE0YL57_9GAST|nr:hypothetical protein RRG08_066184 [Elysia crispata]